MIEWIIVSAVVSTLFWDTFASFVEDVIERVKAKFSSAFRYFQCFIKRIGNKVIGIVKTYMKNSQYEWTETYEQQIPEAEVPPDILSQVKNSYGHLIDVTDNKELKLELGF